MCFVALPRELKGFFNMFFLGLGFLIGDRTYLSPRVGLPVFLFVFPFLPRELKGFLYVFLDLVF